MSPYLQITVGVIPAIIVLAVAAVVTRRTLLPKIIAMALLAACAVSGGVLHIQSAQPEAVVSTGKSQERVSVVYAMLAAGDGEIAQQLLDEMMAETLYVPEYALCNARLQMLSGDYRSAKMLYEKAISAGLQDEDIQQEYGLAQQCLRASDLDLVLLQQSDNYAAGVADLEAILQEGRQAKQDAEAAVNAAVQQEAAQNPELLLEAAQCVLDAEQIYALYLQDLPFDEARSEEIIKKLNSVSKKYPSLFNQPALRLARLKMRLARGEYDALAKEIDTEADYRELMVASELYLNGYITKKDFSKSYGRENLDMYRAIVKQLKQVYDTYYINESAAQRNKVKEYIAQLEYMLENPAIAKLQTDLQDYAEQYNAADSSKVYLQLSSMAQNQGNSSSADRHLTNAMNSVGTCLDWEYADAMHNLIGAINDKDNTEGLKDVDTYVQQILENSDTLQMHDSVKIPQEDDEEEEEKFDFATYFTDYVSKKRTAINIINMETGDFPEVVVEISVDGGIASSAERLKAMLKLEDCGENISNFKVEEISNKYTNVILVCDVSGSMDGSPISSLRNAVSRFIGDKTDEENIGIVTFSSSVEAVYGLDSTVEELNAAVDSMYAYGGTDMYNAVIYAITMMEYDPEAANVIILMSDGYDNYGASQSQINENVCQACVDKGIVLYSIGLGNDVDSAYLNYFAAGTGGSYLYVSDDLTLDTFYAYLHNLLANRYRITYTATDASYMRRFCKVSLQTDELAYDLGYYELGEEELEEELKDKYVHGLDVRQLYKSKEQKDQYINLLVFNFEAEDVVSVSISGKRSYTLNCRRVDSSSYQLTIPANIAADIYTLNVTVNGYKVIFPEELLVCAEEIKTSFGPYIFTCGLAEQQDDTVTMRGNVCLNGWLHFKGAVTLSGDLENDYSALMTDWSGSTIRYNASSATGLAKYLAEKGFAVPVTALGYVTLHNDTNHEPTDRDYEVTPTDITAVSLYSLTFSEPCLSLYPYSIKLDIDEFTTNFENQFQILSATDSVGLFTFDFDGALILTDQSVDFTAKIEAKQNDKYKYSSGTVGKMPLKLSKTNAAVSIDTLKDDYSITFKTQLSFLKADGLGFKLAWGESFKMKEVRFYYDQKLSTNFGGVPVSFNDFQLAVKDIDKYAEPLAWTFVGQTDINVADVSTVLPKLEKYVGDVSVVTFDDTALEFSLAQQYVKLSADVKLFEKLDMASITIQCGKISYTNSLLGLKDQSVAGVIATVERQLDWDSKNCDINLSGEANLVLTDHVIGVSLDGSASVKVSWWVFSKKVALDGKSFAGMYIAEDGDLVFTVRARGSMNNKQKGINVMWSKRHGGETDTKFY